MKSPKSRTLKSHQGHRSPVLREVVARRLKAAVVVVACILSVALGVGSAVMSQALFTPTQPAPGRSVSLTELQRVLEVQAEATVVESGKSEVGSRK